MKECVKTGNWDPSYAQAKDELCVYSELLLRGTRIVVPGLLRDMAVRLAHGGGREWTRTLKSFVEFVMAARSLLDLTPRADVPRFSSKHSLAGLWSRSTRTPTHRREYFVGD